MDIPSELPAGKQATFREAFKRVVIRDCGQCRTCHRATAQAYQYEAGSFASVKDGRVFHFRSLGLRFLSFIGWLAFVGRADPVGHDPSALSHAVLCAIFRFLKLDSRQSGSIDFVTDFVVNHCGSVAAILPGLVPPVQASWPATTGKDEAGQKDRRVSHFLMLLLAVP
jgi:hypothetical protein